MSDLGQVLSRLPAGARQRLMRQVAGGQVADLVGEGKARSQAVPKREQSASIEDWPELKDLRRLQAMGASAKIPNPYYKLHTTRAGATTTINDRTLSNFASYDYLSLNGHPAIHARVVEAIERYGTSVSGSRMVSGERDLHGALEDGLAAVYGVAAALTFVSGHATNVSVLSSLFGPHDLICHDALAHNSIVKGAEASGAHRIAFPHNDWQAVDDLLTQNRGRYRRVVIAIEGLYSMDGDAPDLARFVEVKDRHDALLMVDEAHALGVLGATGRGTGEHTGVPGDAVDIWMGTLSKTLCSAGGYVAGSDALITLLKYTASGFVYSVGLPPAATAAALTALQLMRDEPQRVATLAARSRQFCATAAALGLDTGLATGHAVVPIITQDSAAALKLSAALCEAGINVMPATYPGVEEGRARLRFFLCTDHSGPQVEEALATVRRLAESIAPRCLSAPRATPAT